MRTLELLFDDRFVPRRGAVARLRDLFRIGMPLSRMALGGSEHFFGVWWSPFQLWKWVAGTDGHVIRLVKPLIEVLYDYVRGSQSISTLPLALQTMLWSAQV
jgi:hypothetical protein